MANVSLGFDDLHDATLTTVKLTWSSGVAVFAFDVEVNGYTSARITGRSLRRLVCPREYPWGESVSVNTIRQTEDGILKIEMQSGDEIQIHCGEFLVEFS